MSDNDKQKVWVVTTYEREILGIYQKQSDAMDHAEAAEDYDPSLEIYVDDYEVM